MGKQTFVEYQLVQFASYCTACISECSSRLKFAALLVFLLSVQSVCDAQVFRIENFKDEYQLEAHWEVPENRLPPKARLEDALQQKFTPLSTTDIKFHDQEFYWLKIKLQNDLPNALENVEWILHFSLVLTDLSYWAIDESGNVQQGRSGFFVPSGERTFMPVMKGNFVKLNLPPGEVVTLYVKAKSDRIGLGPDWRTRLLHSANYFEELKNKKQLNGIFVGFILLILIYNLFLFFFAKDQAYIYYSCYLLAITAYIVYNTGDLADWLPKEFLYEHPQKISYFKLSTYFIAITYLTFLRSFLDMPKVMPKWDRAFRWFIYAAFPVAVIDFFFMKNTHFNYSEADFYTVGYALVFLTLSFVFLIPLMKLKDKKRFFIIAGVLAMGIGSFLTVIARIQSIDYSTGFFKVGTVLEVVIFSLGLAYRQREAELQKQQASFELEKSKILQQQKDTEAQRLEELNEVKTRLYTNITHEFRTPLTVIRGMADNIEGHEKERLLIRRNSDNLLRLINQLLDLSKLESGSLRLELVQGDIVNYLQYLTESFYSLAQENGIRLTFYSEERKLDMDFDEVKVQHIVYNLLSNAIKFTQEGDKVVLHVRRSELNSEPWLQLKVSDTGVGISEEDLGSIFQRFYQADSSSTRTWEGTGIGLSLTKDLVEMMDGKIKVESQLGEGTHFTILLPIKCSKSTRPFEVNSMVHSEDISLAENGEPEAQTSEPADDKPLVLIIEDNRDVTAYIESILRNDYQILTARNGQAGIDRAIEHVPDIIISDVMMPEKNGYEVCEILKNDERTSHIPIILLTAKASIEDRLEGLRGGADAYLTKPFEKEELFVRLEKLVELRRALMERFGQLQIGPENTATSAAPDELTEKSTGPDPRISQEEQFLMKLRRTVEARIQDEDFNIEELCRAANLSNVQLNRKLKALTGLTPSKFVRSIRLGLAKEMLKDPELNISEIAYDVGFNDPNYFTRAFTELFGKPPSSFR